MSKVIHFEIPMDDPQRAVAFYTGVFGWEINRFGDQPYWLVQAGADDEPGANGAMIERGDVHRSPILVIGVDDLDDALRRVEQNGGRTVQGKLAVPGVGWSAYVTDPEGNTVGVFQPDPDARPV